MANLIARYLDATLTQGAADAFVQGELVTGIIPANGMAYKLLSLEIYKGSPVPAVNGAIRYWSLTRDTKAATALMSDIDCIYSDLEGVNLLTSGAVYQSSRELVALPDGLMIVEPSIFFQLDSSGTALANVFQVRVYYEEIKLSEVEILRLLNNA